MKQVTGVENYLQIESTDDIFENISKSNLKAAAEVFIYLYPKAGVENMCPFELFNTWFETWSSFYINLFKTQSTDKIILTLNKFIKTTTRPSRNVAEYIFMRIETILPLKYKCIQSRLPKKRQNSEHLQDFQISDSSEGNFNFPNLGVTPP